MALLGPVGECNTRKTAVNTFCSLANVLHDLVFEAHHSLISKPRSYSRGT